MTEKLKIVMVDDDPDDREFFQESLEALGIKCDLSFYVNGKDFLDALNDVNEDSIPDIVFLDLNMPKLNGIETLKKIRNNQLFKIIPVIAIYSTSFANTDQEKTFAFGADAFITKPNNFNDLRILLKNVLSIDWKNRKTDGYNSVVS